MGSGELIEVTAHNRLPGLAQDKPVFSFVPQPVDGIRSVKDLLAQREPRFECSLEWNSTTSNITGIHSDCSLWFPTRDGYGLKVILCNRKNQLFVDTKQELDNLIYLKERGSSVFPRIEWAAQADLRGRGEKYPCLVVRMEDVRTKPPSARGGQKKSPLLVRAIHKVKQMGLPARRERSTEEILGAEHLVQCPSSTAERCVREFTRWQLMPVDDWYKSTNLISGKIVDCHEFEFFPARYAFPLEGNITVAELQDIYQQSPSASKGILYQGYQFANGYSFPGYSSDGQQFDSYRKLPFLPFQSVKGGRVLDVGCNVGFFSFQAAIHGAAAVTAIDHDPKNVSFCKSLNQRVFDFNQVEFLEDDAVAGVMEHRYGDMDVVFLLSVLHNIYPNMIGADPFLEKIASMTRFLAFETPIAHPVMSLSSQEVYDRLRSIFDRVRLLYVYKAFSSGYRAIFLCDSRGNSEIRGGIL